MALIDKLTAIGDGFRSSRGTTQQYTLYEMAVLAAEPEAPPAYGVTLTDKLTALADGFRLSRGTTQKYTLDEMAVLAAESIDTESYTLLDFIESSGTQYIDTGYCPTPNTRVVSDVYILNYKAATKIYGEQDTNAMFDLGVSGYQWQVRYGDKRKAGATLTANGRYKVDQTGATATIGAATVTSEGSFSGVCTNPMYIFAYNNNGTAAECASFKLYSLQIYDGDVLVRDFVPAMNQEGVAGLLDQVSNVFYMNQGTGTFSRNKLPSEFPMYIESNGTQYINLGCNLKADTKIELRCRVTRNSQRDYEALFGTRYQQDVYAFVFFARFGGQDIPVYARSGAETRGENFVYDEDITLVCHNKTATWSTDTGDVYSFETTGNVTETMYNMFLFDLNNAGIWNGQKPDGSNSVMRVYYLKMYSGDDVIRSYVPAVDSDGVPHLYEEVLGTTHYPLSGDALTIPSS